MRQDAPDVLSQTLIQVMPMLGAVIRHSLAQYDANLHPPHFMLLSILRGGPLPLSVIAERQRVSVPTISNTVTVLERRGYVTRARDADDRRVVHVALTPDGHTLHDNLQQGTRALLEQAVHTMLPDERAALHTGLHALLGAFIATGLLPPAALPGSATHDVCAAPPSAPSPPAPSHGQ